MLGKSRRLGFLGKFVFILNIFAIIGLLLSYSASFIDPMMFWPIAFFGLAYPVILLGNVAFVIYWLIRKPLFSLIPTLIILAGWGLMNRHITFSSDDRTGNDDNTLRVMTFNTHLLENLQNSKISTKDQLIEILNDVNPDILCLQEFQSNLSGDNMLSHLLKDEGNFQELYFAPSTQNRYHGVGQVIYSKYPVVNSGTILDGSYGVNRIIYADIVRNRDTIRVYNVHLRSFVLQQEDKSFIQNPATAEESEKRATKRVGRKLKQAFTHRSLQAKALANHIKGTKYKKIVMGDFNDTPMSFSVSRVGETLNNAFRRKGNGWGVTHYDIFPILQIDYIFSDFETDYYQIVKRKLSDHYPIFADLVVN